VIEPLLEVQLADELVFVGKHHRGGDDGEKVIVLQEVYNDVQAQEHLAEICRVFAEDANVRFVACEGADAEVGRSPVAGGISELVAASSSVSAGVLFLLNEHPGLVEAWGVDDLGLHARSSEAMTRLMLAQPLREAAFEHIRPLLEAARSRWYPKDVSRLRSSLLTLLPERLPLARQVELIEKQARETEFDLGAFPSVRGYLEVAAAEREVDEKRFEKQKADFVERLVDRLFGWFTFTPPNRLTIDRAAVEPILDYWCERTGMSRADLDKIIEERGWEAPLADLKAWLETSLVADALHARGTDEEHVFLEELMRLALRLDVPFFDLHDFRDLVAARREVTKVRATLADELPEAVTAIIDRLEASEAARLRAVEDELDVVYRALRAEVPPLEAEAAQIDAARLLALCEELAALAGTELSPQAREQVSRLEPTLAEAAVFLDHALGRGRHMATRTVELMRELGEDRALLVAGGFHERSITHELENERGVSWSVLAPRPSAGASEQPMLPQLGGGP
jgi:hypothetical protein